MNWEWITQTVQVALALLLIARLLILRLHRIYTVFCLFLLADVSGSVFWFVWSASSRVRFDLDYRTGWFAGKVAVWILTVCTIYALLAAILTSLQGIHRLSRRVLHISFAIAVGAGLLTAVPEYWASGLPGPRFANPLDRLVESALIFDRVLASGALLVLMGMLILLLWFPIETSRNLIVFSVGFVVYFAAKTALLLQLSVWSHTSGQIVGMAIALVMSVCMAYWTLFISPAGENVILRAGHAWRPAAQQERMVLQLESLNASLLRAARR